MPRIEALRKRDVTIDFAAAPAPADVAITMARHEYTFGAALSAYELAAHPELEDWFPSRFNAVTDELNMKWEFQEPEEGVFTYENGDIVYDFAIRHDIVTRGHDIYAEGGIPAWLVNLPVDGSVNSVQAAVWRRLNAWVDRYGEGSTSHDVVNEITHFDKVRNKWCKKLVCHHAHCCRRCWAVMYLSDSLDSSAGWRGVCKLFALM